MTTHQRLARWWRVLLCLVILSTTGQVRAKEGPYLIEVCPQFGYPIEGSWYLHNHPTDVGMDANSIQTVLHIYAGRNAWVGYDHGGFAWERSTVHPVLTMTLFMVDGEDRWIEIYSSGSTYFVLAYANTEWHTDNDGNHAGYHPCSAVEITPSEYQQFLDGLLQASQPVTIAK